MNNLLLSYQDRFPSEKESKKCYLIKCLSFFLWNGWLSTPYYEKGGGRISFPRFSTLLKVEKRDIWLYFCCFTGHSRQWGVGCMYMGSTVDFPGEMGYRAWVLRGRPGERVGTTRNDELGMAVWGANWLFGSSTIGWHDSVRLRGCSPRVIHKLSFLGFSRGPASSWGLFYTNQIHDC